MGGRAITGKSFSDLEDALLAEIGSARRRDPFSPVHVLVGSNLLGAHLKRRLAERLGGLFNVHFLTFMDIVSLLEDISRIRPARRLPGFAERVLITGMLSSGGLPVCFGEVSGMRGFGEALLATFSDLAESGCTPGIARSIIEGNAVSGKLGERVAGVLSMYARYRERLSECGEDAHARFMKAVDKVDTASLEGPLLVYGFYDFNEMQWRLIKSIADGPGVTMFVPWSEEEPFGFSGKFLERLGESGFGFAGVSERKGRVVRRPKTFLLSSPGEEEEVRGVVRMVLALARDKGMRFGDIGIILPSPDNYWPLLREALLEADVPYFVRGSAVPNVGPAARGAIRLLGLLRGRMERSGIVEFLVSAPLSMPGGNGSGFDPLSLWIRESAEMGLIGEGGWVEENRMLLERIERSGDGGGDAERVLDSVRLVGGVMERIYEAMAGFGVEATWADFTRSFSALIRDLFVPSGDTEGVCFQIEGLEDLDEVSPPVSFDTFSGIVESVISASFERKGHLRGGGVNVLSLGQARGISFKAVFLAGLTESALPRIVRQDPFLKDDERAKLAEITGGEVSLSRKIERIDEEALIFRLVLDSAEDELVCSYPRFESCTGKERIPSSFLRFVEGYSLDKDHGETLKQLRLSSRTVDVRAGEMLSSNEYDLKLACKYREGSGFLPVNPFLSRGIELVRSRWGKKRFTPFDGVFSSREALEEVGRMLDERGWSFSPTSMESYARCPFAFFLANILGVEFHEEPEWIITISPLQKGRLVHSILAGLYGELKDRGLLPVAGAPEEAILDVAGDVASGFLAGYAEKEPVGLPVFWEMEKRNISDSIKILLGEELSEGDDYIPSYFERPFGGAGDRSRVSFACGGRTIFFHGRIDRIDLSQEGGFRVIDYKTGRLVGDDQCMDGGDYLQLPVYLLAASNILGRPVHAGTAEYRRVGTRSGRRRLRFSGGRWDRGKGELERILKVITRGIERGLFLAPASGDTCRFCELRAACPSGSTRLFEAKAAGDERCRDYLVMRHMAEVEE